MVVWALMHVGRLRLGRALEGFGIDMQHIDVSRVVHAPTAKVFARYSDFPSWTRWSGLGKVSVRRPGDANGVGAVRVIQTGPLRIVEEVTASEPPSALTYRLLSGLPIHTTSAESPSLPMAQTPASGGNATSRPQGSRPGAPVQGHSGEALQRHPRRAGHGNAPHH